MRAVTFDPATDRFLLRDLPEPTVTGKDVLIRVDACGLNPVDAKIIHWKTAVPSMSDTWVPGLDVSGHVVAVGIRSKRSLSAIRSSATAICSGRMAVLQN